MIYVDVDFKGDVVEGLVGENDSLKTLKRLYRFISLAS